MVSPLMLAVRVLKISAVITLAAAFFMDFVEGSDAWRKAYGHRPLSIAGSVAIVCGLFNMIITRPSRTMEGSAKPWILCVKLKFVLATVGSTPLLDLLCRTVSPSISAKEIINLRAGIIAIVIVMSSWMKAYRDGATVRPKTN